MAEETMQERTEQPTPKRIREAREKGNVAKSMEISSVAIMLGGLLALTALGPMMGAQLKSMSGWLFGNSAHFAVSPDTIQGFFTQVGFQYVKALSPVILVLVVVAFGVSYAQVGSLFATQALEPKFDKLDIVKGMKRLLSARSLFTAGRDVVKLFIIAIVTYFAVSAEIDRFVLLPDLSVSEIGTAMFGIATRIALKILLALLAIAALDYSYQKFDYMKKLRMTRQELREELKQTEGNPLIKGRIRAIQREMSRRRMMQDVREADVVVTNPTHLAIALKYDAEKMGAPTVVAKGQRLIAEAIRKIAEECGIPIVENKPLARVLFKSVEIGMQIPADLYKAVAEVLAYVYSLRGKGRSAQ